MKLRHALFATLALLLCGLIGSFATSITAQDTASDDATTNAPAAAATDDDDSHRRLPAYYNDLVTPGQRKQIYSIQDRYEDQIEELKRQLREVVTKRDAEVLAVLQPEQRDLLDVVKEQSRMLREARAKAAARLKEQLPDDTATEDDVTEEAGN
jgi:Spy/CpxP family protein refolding chaperone